MGRGAFAGSSEGRFRRGWHLFDIRSYVGARGGIHGAIRHAVEGKGESLEAHAAAARRAGTFSIWALRARVIEQYRQPFDQVLTSPDARAMLGELEFARHTNERTRASYLPPNFEPVATA